MGEFNVWDVNCPKLREEWRHLQSTTALRGDSEDGVLLTGTSTGYIQVREGVVMYYHADFIVLDLEWDSKISIRLLP